MAKTAPVKKAKASTSIHSRAAKRASSPSIDTDKSLKDAKPPASHSRPSILAVHAGAGISKKSKNGRKAVLSAKAKRRQEASLDRAEAVMDKKEKKVEKSKGRARNVQERSKAWEDLNRKIAREKREKEEADELAQKENLKWEDEDGDDEEGMEIEDAVPNAAGIIVPSGLAVSASTMAPEAVTEDEIL